MSAISPKRVAITGMGVISPIGSDLDTLWESLTLGKSGITPVENLPMQSLPIRSAGEVKNFTGAIEDYGQLDKQLQRAIKKNMKVMCREIEMGVAAAQKALAHSGLGLDRDPERCGCLFGCDYILTRPEEFADGILNARSSETGQFQLADWPTKGLPKVNPLWLLKYLPNMPNSHVSIYNDFRGPNNSITVCEASSNLALAEAASIIQRGAADVMLVGATGTRIHPLRTTHISLIENLASERSNPAEMARPFDRSSDGMVLGEGAGAFLLEAYEHAEARGAKIWGEIVGSGSSMVGPTAGNRDYLREAIRKALSASIASAGSKLPKHWHLHAFGLSDPQTDASESLAIADVLADHDSIPVVAAKSYFGNLGAGGGTVELICSLLAMEHNQLFPIQNLQTPISSATWKPAQAKQPAGRAVVHSSFTHQGQASSIVVAAA